LSENDSAVFSVVLAAAGKSSRFAGRSSEPAIKKPFAQLNGKPVWLCAAEKFLNRDDVAQLIVVVAPEDLSWFRQYYINEINRFLITVVAGGAERIDSVRSALLAVSNRSGYVAIHDAARPCVKEEDIEKVFQAAQQYGAALLASPMLGTVKRVGGGIVETTVSRSNLWEAQTPQVFRRDIILDAYQQKVVGVPTDDAQLVEMAGLPVHIVPTDRWNIKITTQTDLKIAKWLTVGE
jgi:2-C-methyl-D-erythritol 4-phosphate cytidylyltransferase